MDKATFAAGCFWGVEAAFRKIDGVVDAAVGYCGGSLHAPTYEDVCSGSSGHAEVVQLDFNPEKVSYEKLLDVFWECHDPTTRNRQGPDVGTQYRSAIFFHDSQQESAALKSKAALNVGDRHPKEIVTEVVPAATFYRAEEYHQRYFEKHGTDACGI